MNDPAEEICRWSARKMQPVVLIYVGLVFLIFILLSYFIFHSMDAVKALAITGGTFILTGLPAVTKRIEYRLTKHSLEQRPLVKNKVPTYSQVFPLDQFSHIKLMQHGFKFYLHRDEMNSLRRFWKMHVLTGYSGVVPVEKRDMERVLGVLQAYL